MPMRLVRPSIWMILPILSFLEDTIGTHSGDDQSALQSGRMFMRLANGIMDNPGDAKYGMTKEQLFEGYQILKDKGAKAFRHPCLSGKQYGDE